MAPVLFFFFFLNSFNELRLTSDINLTCRHEVNCSPGLCCSVFIYLNISIITAQVAVICCVAKLELAG